MHSDSRKAIIAAFLANLGIAIAKVVGFVFTGATSMLAEAIHSGADSANQGLLLLGGNLAQKGETAQRQFGHGRERFFWAFVVALVIFTLGSVFAIYEGIEKVLHPHQLESPIWAVVILVVAIGLETWSFRTAIVEANKTRGGASWWSFIHHSRVPELPVVLLEDLGALLGLVVALTGVTLAMLTGDARFDAMGSIAIGLLLGAIAIVLASETRSLLLGEAATAKTTGKLNRVFADDPAVKKLIHMRTEHMGPEQLLVAAKVEFADSLSFEQVVSTINTLENNLRQAVPIARVIYIEPDFFKPTAD